MAYDFSTNRAIAAQLRSVQHALRWRRRVRLGVRVVWIALLVWCAGLAAILLGAELQPFQLVVAALLVLVVGLLYAWFSQPSLTQLTHGLDRFYRLNEQTATALELAQRGPANEIEQRLLHEAGSWLAGLRHYVARLPLMPWREAETLLALALVALGLTVALGPQQPQAQAPAALPDLPPPVAPTALASPQPTDLPVGDQPGTQPGPGARAAADALADALADNGATRPAADALRRGDLQGAASELRELADGAEQLSEEARRDIAEGLREAAGTLREEQPSLADRLEQQADGLEQGGEDAEEALDDLARTVEELDQPQDEVVQAPDADDAQAEQDDSTESQNEQQEGDLPGTEQQGGGGIGSLPGAESRSTPPDAAQAQGDELPLPSTDNADGPTTAATGPQGPTIEIDAGGTGSSSGANAGGNRNEPLPGRADPLIVPPEYRDVVENYFTPAR
jgi:hypothetical protein